ncbi:unnamed protein product, partial [Urochloa humidicola]
GAATDEGREQQQRHRRPGSRTQRLPHLHGAGGVGGRRSVRPRRGLRLLRFHERNWRCCMCRSFCPTVVITRNATGGGTGGQPQEGAEAAFPKPPLASGGAGQAGRRLSYHNGMAAYFDDEGQYEKV